MFLFASNLLTLIFRYTACCSNFYLQFFSFFDMFKLSSDHCIFTEFKFFMVRWHIFIAQWISFYWSIHTLVLLGGNIMYILYIHHYNSWKYCKAAVVSKCALKKSEFQKKMNWMKAIDFKLFVNYLTFYWVIL